MAKRKEVAIKRFVSDVERNANRLRKEVQRFSRNVDLRHDLDELAGELRRGAAAAAAEVEHYLHDLRRGLEKGPAKKPALSSSTAGAWHTQPRPSSRMTSVCERMVPAE